MAVLKNLKQEAELAKAASTLAIDVDMVFAKSTPGTHVYKAVATGKPPAITSLYIAQWAFAGEPPKSIKVSVS